MSSQDELKEVLWPKNGLIYDQEFMLPALCKPKLIPLKSLTIEKLERMQSENIEKIREMEQFEKDQLDKEKKEENISSTNTKFDIWRAEAD